MSEDKQVPLTPPASIGSLVVMGDSFTEGLEDDLGVDGRHLGWADRVAAALATRSGRVRYANLAVRGRLLDQVVDEQLPVAVALRPDLATFHAGPNDVLRPRTDVAAVLRRYDRAVGSLTGDGVPTLLFTVIERAGGTGRTAARLAARFGAFNAGVRASAARHGALLADLGAVPALQDRRLWHEDRLHLVAEGHARVAAGVLEALGISDPALLGGEPGWWRVPLPPGPITGRRADLVADVRWVRRYFAPWVGRRLRGVSSGDGLTAKHATLVDVLAREDPMTLAEFGSADDDIDPDTFAAGRAQQQLLRSVHQHLRSELQEVRDVVAQVVSGEADVVSARHHINPLTMRQNYWTVGSFCAAYCRVVAIHHTIEDLHMFPGLVTHQPDLAPVVARLSAEHETIAQVLTELDEALIAMVTDPDGHRLVQAWSERLATQLLEHLAYEEEQLLPAIGRLTTRII
jgi:lysophospholipase L1-like esterase